MLATDDAEVIARYRAFGWALGLAFQLNDDLLGASGGRVGDRQGRRPTCAPEEDDAGDLGSEPRRPRRIKRGCGSCSLNARVAALTDAEVAEAAAILERSGAREYDSGEARRYRDEALAELAGLPLEPTARAELELFVAGAIAA